MKKSRLENSPKKTNGIEKIGEKEGEKRVEEKVIGKGDDPKEGPMMKTVKKEEEKKVFTNRRAKTNHIPAGVIKVRERERKIF